jgi:hypothetical protein
MNNHFLLDKRIGLGSITKLSLARYFSTIKSLEGYARPPFKRGYRGVSEALNPEFLALEHMKSGKPTTSLVINKILLNQNLSVTDSKLEELLKVQGVEIDLDISKPENSQVLSELTGKSKYKGFSGVYMFIHKNTAQKYVGSSNLLRRRMDYYFKGDFPLVGKFLPLLYKEGLKAFKLIIFKLDSNKFSLKDALILEQYYLLNKEFNLNTLRVVNVGSSKGDAVYVYDLTCSTLYYKAKSRIELKRVLGIHTETSKKYVDSKIPYLKKFLLLSYPIPTASISNISAEELVNIMQKERQDMYKLGTRRSLSVELEIKEGNKFVGSGYGYTLNFDSLASCVEYLKGLGLTIKRDTLTKYIKNEKVFQNFLCKYSKKALPENFEQVGLIMDEYKNLKIDTYLPFGLAQELALIPKGDRERLKVNRKNKPLIVRGENFEKEFESIMDTVKYFYTLNIKLDRKTLDLRLKDGKIYKNYFFAYK